jgi:diguanylate cyclase (GGDEF)-like protein
MTPDSESSPGVATREGSERWPIWSQRAGFITYLLTVEFVAVIASIAATTSVQLSRQAVGRTVLILVLAVFFEEATSRAGRLRLRLSDHLKPDMTSVWFIPAAIVLPATYAVVCIAGLLWYVWLRQQRPAGEAAFRKVGTAATIIVACLAANWAVGYVAAHPVGIPHGVMTPVAVGAALIVYAVTNRALVTVALLSSGVRGRALLGSWEDNLLEVATLCLGGLTTLAVRDEPWLAVLVLLPMVLLQRGALTHQLEVAATTDVKTGLLNALAWDTLAKRDLARAHREGKCTALAIIDLDRFKAVNDSYGHLVGDAALMAVGQCLTSELRVYDTLGRFGGEEFVALLPDVTQATAIDIAQRLRIAISRIRIAQLTTAVDEADETSLAASIGVAWAPMDGTDLVDLLHAADAALYVAKRAGRNRVELAHRDTDTSTSSVPPR